MKLPHNEVHTSCEKPEQAAGPEVHEDAGPLLTVQSQPSHYQSVHGVWPERDRRRFFHLSQKGDPSEAIKHNEGDKPLAIQLAPDAIHSHPSGKDDKNITEYQDNLNRVGMRRALET